MTTEINLLKKMGVEIIKKKNYLIATRSKKLKSVNVVTEPYPGFPTDLQAQIMVLMTKAAGTSIMKENPPRIIIMNQTVPTLPRE